MAIVNSFLNVICCNVLASQMTNQMMRIRVIGFTGICLNIKHLPLMFRACSEEIKQCRYDRKT